MKRNANRMGLIMTCRWLMALATLSLSISVQAKSPNDWPDHYIARLEALAALQTLNAELLASPSATKVLERWCRDHGLADDPVIVADRIHSKPLTPSAEQMARLQVADASEVRYRRVELRCGAHVLSKADNWYVPSRLSTEMNRLLEATDTPFGKTIGALEPFRKTLEARLLWTPLPAGTTCRPMATQKRRPAPLGIPEAVLQHRAVLYTRQNLPISEVREVYQDDVLAFSLSEYARLLTRTTRSYCNLAEAETRER